MPCDFFLFLSLLLCCSVFFFSAFLFRCFASSFSFFVFLFVCVSASSAYSHLLSLLCFAFYSLFLSFFLSLFLSLCVRFVRLLLSSSLPILTCKFTLSFHPLSSQEPLIYGKKKTLAPLAPTSNALRCHVSFDEECSDTRKGCG